MQQKALHLQLKMMQKLAQRRDHQRGAAESSPQPQAPQPQQSQAPQQPRPQPPQQQPTFPLSPDPAPPPPPARHNQITSAQRQLYGRQVSGSGAYANTPTTAPSPFFDPMSSTKHDYSLPYSYGARAPGSVRQ